MNINPKIKNFDGKNFINDYLRACGVENPAEYLVADKSYFEDWRNYKDIDNAVALLKEIIDANAKCGILVDCDLDGACSGAIAYNFLEQHGVENIIPYVRKGKSHGLRENKERKENIVAKMIADGIEFLWIPDAGTNDAEECKELVDNGCKVLITDHHIPVVENPNAIVINNQIGNVTNKDLTGAGVTWKTVIAYCDTYGDTVNPSYLSLVAVSLVSDVADFRSMENRAIWNEAWSDNNIKNINNFIGYASYKLNRDKVITSEFVGWSLAPLINAASREIDTERFTTIFYSMVDKVTADVGVAAGRKAKRLQDEIVTNAMKGVEESIVDDHNILVAFCGKGNAPYTGLIANKILGKTHRPVVVLRKADRNHYSGSLRSPVPLLSKINGTKIARAQGHENACGIILTVGKLAKFLAWSDSIDIEQNPVIDVAAILSPKDITLDLCQMVVGNKQLWNNGIDNPKFAITMTLKHSAINCYRKKSITIKFQSNNADYLMFKATEDDIKELSKGGRFTFVVSLKINNFEGALIPNVIIESYERVQNNWEDLW